MKHTAAPSAAPTRKTTTSTPPVPLTRSWPKTVTKRMEDALWLAGYDVVDPDEAFTVEPGVWRVLVTDQDDGTRLALIVTEDDGKIIGSEVLIQEGA